MKKTKQKKKGRGSTILLVVIILAGLSLLLYPSVSNYWNSLHASRAISDYVEAVVNMDTDHYRVMLENARDYNERLSQFGALHELTDEEKVDYYSQLDVLGNGIMGYIEIKRINCFLPIYHGTSDVVLNVAVGHVEGSSLPIGGKNTHTVLSGHRGLPSARLFTDLDKLAVGDTFIIQVLNETMTYEVDQIRIVLPSQVSELQIVPERDYCTLVTCTPYGINTHRMLVRAHRISNEEQAAQIRVVGDALRIQPTIVAPIVAAPIFLLLFILLAMRSRRAERRRRAMKRAQRPQQNVKQE